MSTPIRRSGYLPTLDGWRAISILAVICYHDAIHSLWFFSTRWLNTYGYVGVDVFFAISGILICSRLLDEEQRDGDIGLQSFYIRRAFRILPPALFFLLTIALLTRLGFLAISVPEWFKSFFFFRNYPTLLGGPVGNYTSHLWSLSLEEQFYLILPPLLVVSPKRYRVPVLALLSVLIALHRAMALHARPWSLIGSHAETRLDALFVPALFAVLASDPHTRAIFQRALRFWPALVLLLPAILPFGEGSAWQISLIVYLLPCIVLGSVLNPDNPFGRALEWKPLRFIGRISYSLYLWQQLFFSQHFLPGAHPFGILQSWPLRLVVTFACALASYYLLERPLVRLGHRYAPPATPGRPERTDIPIPHPEPAQLPADA